jgi:hypothetical protein
MMERPPERWVTVEEIAQEVHAPVSLIEEWAKAGGIATRSDSTTHALLVSTDDVEDVAEEEAFRLLSQRALAYEDRD